MTAEVYQLHCYFCFTKVELPAGSPAEPERVPCVRCGTVLRLEWRPAETDAKPA